MQHTLVNQYRNFAGNFRNRNNTGTVIVMSTLMCHTYIAHLRCLKALY